MELAEILFGGLFTIASATSLGVLLLGNACRDWPQRFLAGGAVLSLLVFLLGAAGLLYTSTLAALGVAALLAVQPWRQRSGTDVSSRSPKITLGYLVIYLLFIVFFAIYFMRSIAPEVSPDGATYHLGLTARYLREHGFHPITWNIYAGLSQGMEMLFVFAFAFGRHCAAALVHLAFLVALVWQMWIWGKRHGIPWVGLCGGALVGISPLVGIDASSAYNDVALAAVAFGLFCMLDQWAVHQATRLLPAIGLLAGFGYALKYTAWLGVVYAVGFVAWKTRRLQPVMVVALGALLLVTPWAAKDWLWLHNPVAPFFNRYFPNPYVTIAFEDDYRRYLKTYDLATRWQIPLEATVRGSLGGVLGPVFLLAPLGLAALRKPLGRQLWLATLVYGANYFSNVGARFLIPPMPFVALTMAMAFTALPGLALAMVILHAALSWPPVVAKVVPRASWLLTLTPWRDALHLRPPGRYIKNHLPLYPSCQLIERATPPGSAVFTYKAIPDAYTTRRILLNYESAASEVASQILWSAVAAQNQPTGRLQFRFAPRPLRAMRVNQTASGPDIWSVNEVRIFSGGHELPREASWRLTANSCPWSIQEAFDNSPVTFWRSSEVIHPGMFVEVRFGGLREVDQLVLEGQADQYRLRLELEGETADGNWQRLSSAPVPSEAAPLLGFRRAAATELKRRGIDYVLCYQDDPPAEDFERNRDLWGVQEVGAIEGARLYRLP